MEDLPSPLLPQLLHRHVRVLCVSLLINYCIQSIELTHITSIVWFPNYLFQALSFFNWTVWIAPHNVTLAAVTGLTGVSGLGLNPVPTFDYNQLYIDPWISPFFTTVNIFAGACVAFPIILALWFNNVWNTGYLPINSNAVWNNQGKRYNVSLIVNDDGLFDQQAYENVSPCRFIIAS